MFEEGKAADAGNALLHHYAADDGLKARPRRRRIDGIIRHRAAAADGQHAVLQRPLYIRAAIAAEFIRRLHLLHRKFDDVGLFADARAERNDKAVVLAPHRRNFIFFVADRRLAVDRQIGLIAVRRYLD